MSTAIEDKNYAPDLTIKPSHDSTLLLADMESQIAPIIAFGSHSPQVWAMIPATNTVRVGSNEYIISGYGSQHIRPFETFSGEPYGHISFPNPTDYIPKAKWAHSPKNDWISATWDRPDGRLFKQQYGSTLTRLRSFMLLKPNWDSYGAVPPSPRTAANVFLLFWDLYQYFNSVGEHLPEPFVAPVPDGRIQLEWDNAGKELEITIDEQMTMRYLLWEGDDAFTEDLAATTAEVAGLLLHKLLGKNL